MKRITLALLLLAEPAVAHTGNGIVADPATRTLYFTDALRSCVWRVEPSGKLDCFAAGRHGNNLARDAAGNLYIDNFNRALWRIAPDGQQTRLLDGGSVGSIDELLAVDAAGNIYFSGGNDFRGRRPVLLKHFDNGTTVRLAGGTPGHADGHGEQARFNALNAAAWGADGSLYITDAHSVRRALPDGTVSTVAGAETPGFQDGPAHQARFTYLLGIAVDNAGNIYVAERGNQCVRRISAHGEVTTILRPDDSWTPVAVTVAGQDVYVLERKFLNVPHDLQRREDMPRVLKITPRGKRSVIVTIKGDVFAGVGLIALPLGIFMMLVLVVRWTVLKRRREWRQPEPLTSAQ